MRRAAIANMSPELPAAEDADGFAGEDHGLDRVKADTRYRVDSRTVLRLRLRGTLFRRARTSSRHCSAMICAASSAAFVAPGFADRQRADGNAGGHLHDRQQRIEAVERLAIAPARPAPAASSSTPHMPGRCAAPPAPAMITFSPRDSADAWRTRTADPACDVPTRSRFSYAHAKLLEHLGGVAHRLPVATCCP